jgi:hypothetical protein
MLHKDTFEVCTLRMTETAMFDNACEHFTPPTVGDRIRALSDADLAELFVHGLAYDVSYEEWYSTLLPGTVCFSSKQKALEATLEELRREVKDE